MVVSAWGFYVIHASLDLCPLQVRRHCVSQVSLAGVNMVDYDYTSIEYLANVSCAVGFARESMTLLLSFDRFLTTQGLSS